jgi:hypothetical protein
LKPKPENPLGSLFGPDMWVKLNANPVTREYMKDPSFVAKMQSLSTNPSAMGQLGSDPKMSQALGVILGMGTEGFSAMSGDRATAPGGPFSGARSSANGGATVEDDEDMLDSDDEGAASGTVKDEKAKRSFKHVGDMTPEEAKSAREASFKAAGMEVPKELTEEEKKELAEKQQAAKEKAEADRAKAKVRAEADKEKNAGNELYKKRDFPGAISKYEKAIEVDPTNIVYYTNLSAVFMEMKEHQKAIETATKGVEIGKQNMANYVDVAKAYARSAAACILCGTAAVMACMRVRRIEACMLIIVADWFLSCRRVVVVDQNRWRISSPRSVGSGDRIFQQESVGGLQ